ncbi:hypothetical protein [Neisseria sp. 74A18]|uniref:hypothetical protein n=1 Tax=Neisseria sp. 74A18 TaxID=1696094 RepID=UPI0012E32054|nr:hypothetical protein [Neisseria sp. 74A18]
MIRFSVVWCGRQGLTNKGRLKTVSDSLIRRSASILKGAIVTQITPKKQQAKAKREIGRARLIASGVWVGIAYSSSNVMNSKHFLCFAGRCLVKKARRLFFYGGQKYFQTARVGWVVVNIPRC